MSKKYIEETEFKDFKQNFHLLIKTLNHNITKISKNTDDLSKTVSGFKEDFLDVKSYVKTSRKIVNLILGILATIISGVAISFFVKSLI